jgi:acid phosphatase type 7
VAIQGKGASRAMAMSRRLTITLLLACTALAAPASAEAFELRTSSAPDRSASVPLASATASGNVHVFVSPEAGATQVRFWLDDPARAGAPRRTEGNPPWDFNGTNADNTARPFDTATLANGTHSITAEMTLSAGGTEVVSSQFTVTNGSLPPDQVHVSWTGDPATTLTVVWRTRNTTTPSQLEYRRAGTTPWLPASGAPRPSGTTGTLHEVTLAGLTPATAYEYRVRADGGGFGQTFTTRTAPSPGHVPFDFIYFADTGIAGRTDGLATGTTQSVNEIAALDPLLVLPGGDYAYYDADKRFGTLDNTIDAWFNQEQPIFTRSPVMPTYGNHEVLLGEGFEPWVQRFATPAGFDSRRNYSFDVGDVHFISILAVDNPGGLSAATFAWLEQDIEAALDAGQRWIIPYMHVPAFSDGSSHGSNFQLRSQLGPLFESFGVKIVLTAHDQSYERTYPLTDIGGSNTPTSTSLSCYSMNDGVSWVKVSPAGKLSNKGGNFSQFLTNPPPSYTAFRDNSRHHFARVRVGETSIRVEAWGLVGDGSAPVIQDAFEYRLGACPAAYPRPGGATPLRVPLVPAYAACTAPNSQHVPPLSQPSCTAPALESNLLTLSNTGAGSGAARLDVSAGNPATLADEADVQVMASAGDVRRAGSGADHSGQLLLTTRIRVTDGVSGTGQSTAATVQDGELAAPVSCVATAQSSLGGNCNLTTTLDTLVPGFAREGGRMAISTFSLELKDAGPDGQFGATGLCFPACGSGDERRFLRQGVFLP